MRIHSSEKDPQFW